MNKLIVVEGSIGAGKTHFLNLIRDNYNDINIFKEDLAGYKTLVRNFYENPKVYGYPFQMSMLVRKAHNTLKAQATTGISLIERVIDSNYKVFAFNTHRVGNMTDDDYQNYITLYEDFKEITKKPDAYIFLETSLDLALRRIQHRGRSGESNIDENYMRDINCLYSSWIESIINKNGIKHIHIYMDRNLNSGELIERFEELLNRL